MLNSVFIGALWCVISLLQLGRALKEKDSVSMGFNAVCAVLSALVAILKFAE